MRRSAPTGLGTHRADRLQREVVAVPAATWPRPAIDAAAIAMITSPIGLPELAGKEPAVIAVGVAAKLIMTMFPHRSQRAVLRQAQDTSTPSRVKLQGA